jgi:microcystin-dependent protein
MILAPSPVQQFTDNNGNLLVGGKLFLFAAGTTTPQAAFTDASGGTPLPNPIILNDRGEVAPSAIGTSCGLWLDPTLSYKFILSPANDTNPPTNPFWTVDNVVSPQSAILAQLQQYIATLGGTPIGGMIDYGGATAPPGWILCFGQAISRTAFPQLFAVIGTLFGTGDGSTTFNLPDFRGRASIGADNMGGSAANRVTEAVSGILASSVGQVGGSQDAQQDTLSAGTTVTISDAGHAHGITVLGIQPVETPTPNLGNTSIGSNGSQTLSTQAATTGISATAETTVTSALTGTSQNMPPVQVVNRIIYSAVVSS